MRRHPALTCAWGQAPEALAGLGSIVTKHANIHEAKTQFSKLAEAARAGEEVIIQKAGKPPLRLVARRGA